jgi:hypothetical protein
VTEALSRPDFKLLYGGGDMLKAIDDLRERITRGEVEGLVICVAGENLIGGTWAYREDMALPWARLQAAVDTMQYKLVSEGLSG